MISYFPEENRQKLVSKKSAQVTRRRVETQRGRPGETYESPKAKAEVPPLQRRLQHMLLPPIIKGKACKEKEEGGGTSHRWKSIHGLHCSKKGGPQRLGKSTSRKNIRGMETAN